MEISSLVFLLLVSFQGNLIWSLTDRNFFYRSTAANGTSILCLSCPPGTFVAEACTIPKTTGRCQVCPQGHFQPTNTDATSCRPCVTECIDSNTNATSNSTKAECFLTQNICLCQNNSCKLNSKCPPGTEPVVEATRSRHTVCVDCPEGKYSDVYSRTEMCKNKTNCALYEVAVVDGNTTRDRVCIPRNGVYHRNSTEPSIQNTEPSIPYSTVSSEDPTESEHDGKQSSTNKTLYIVIVVLLSFVFFIAIGISIKVCNYKYYKYIYRKANKHARCIQESEEYQIQEHDVLGNSCGIGDDSVSLASSVSHINERSQVCNYQRRNLTLCNKICNDTESDNCDQQLLHNSVPANSKAGFRSEGVNNGYSNNSRFKYSDNSDLGYPDDSCFDNLYKHDLGSLCGDMQEKNWSPFKESEGVSSSTLVKRDECLTRDTNIHNEKTTKLPFQHLPMKKTILSTDWQWCGNITNEGCVIQLPNSDVITTFPPGVLPYGNDSASCHKTVHADISRLAEELNLQEDAIITSPSPEYHMDKHLASYVQIKIPHRMRKHFQKIKVESYCKHQSGIVELAEVTKFNDRSEADEKLDMFCVVNSEFVIVYTNHFSGFVCTTCSRYIEYELSAGIYERKGLLDNHIDTVDVMLYLKGPKATIKDFKTIIGDMIEKEFCLLETKPVTLLERNQQSEGGQLQFRIDLISRSRNNWAHRITNNNDPMADTLVLVNPENLIRECEKHIICSPGTKWHLQRRDKTNSSCDFYVQIVHKEKPTSPLDKLHHVTTNIPASVHFYITAPLVAMGTATTTTILPEAITDVVMTLKEHLDAARSVELVKRMGCLKLLPPVSTRSEDTDDIRYDYWYNAFTDCYFHLKDQFINRVLDGLRKMKLEPLAQLVSIHAPQRVAFLAPRQHHTAQESGRITPEITHPSSADSNKQG
ncbi:uncharacterized protein [Argopecten irradians]|uniref:uncharacterized protein n=1 Tax=Argopecten irradians TaxID=31199 RepID=UPI00371534CF